MGNVAMWSLVVGFFMPPAIAFLQRQTWPDWLRALVALGACVAAAAVTVVVEAKWDWRDWIGSALLVLVTAISTYQHVWKPTGVAPAIEKATSPKPRKR